ncbi:MAG: MTAP family purine nucleoside phosphorylase [Magnetococcales bacterium]|nr:MTAP family purine nucleoside phosphorylase [Magnetococcales bacterium]
MKAAPMALIGGTSLLESDHFRTLPERTVQTAYGDVQLRVSDRWVFLQRHGVASYTPPHLINHRANLTALQEIGVERVLAIGSVGSMRPELAPGALVVPDDFLSMQPPPTLYDDARGHCVPGFDPQWRAQVMAAFQGIEEVEPVDGGVYWQSVGPRFETPAEIRMMQSHTHLVGMTVASESTLATELELPYAAICMVDNYANGVAGDVLSFEAFKQQVRDNQAVMLRLVEALLVHLAPAPEIA